MVLGYRVRRALAALVVASGLAGCDYSYGPMQLKPGASADDVRRQMGAATDEKRLPDGGRVWWYVRGPQGFHTYKAEFDKDEKLTRLTQVLTEAIFRNIVAEKSTKDEVLELIGRPRETMTFPNLNEEVWTWRYQDGTFNKYLHVHFRPDGVVTKYVLEQESTNP